MLFERACRQTFAHLFCLPETNASPRIPHLHLPPRRPQQNFSVGRGRNYVAPVPVRTPLRIPCLELLPVMPCCASHGQHAAVQRCRGATRALLLRGRRTTVQCRQRCFLGRSTCALRRGSGLKSRVVRAREWKILMAAHNHAPTRLPRPRCSYKQRILSTPRVCSRKNRSGEIGVSFCLSLGRGRSTLLRLWRFTMHTLLLRLSCAA